MKVGYFCTAGYTEVNGIEPFLRKLNPSIEWARLFPVLNKPGPKPARSDRPHERTIRRDEGATGAYLITRMAERLERYPDPSVEAWLVIDDEDCRLCPKPQDASPGSLAAAHTRLAAMEAEILDSLPAAIERRPLVFLLAAPEVEAWMIADWDHGFGAHLRRSGHPTIDHDARRYFRIQINDGPLEAFGCPCSNPGCSRKLSTEFQTWLDEQDETNFRGTMRYSKRFDGPALLAALEPLAVAIRCPLYFEPAYRRIRALL